MTLELPLSCLPVVEDDDVQTDIVLRLGDVPAALDDVVWATKFISVSADGRIRVALDAVAHYLVIGGREIIIAPHPEAPARDIELLVTGLVAGAILHQRGDFPLHASCVEIAGKAVAISGNSGFGKSTLAGKLLREGAALHSDDICVVRFDDAGGPIALQGAPSLRLWPDSQRVIAAEGEAWTPIRNNHDKLVRVARAPRRPPLPLAAIVRLGIRADGDAPGLTRLRGPEAMMPITDIVYRARLARVIGRRDELFRDAMRLAARVPIYRLRRKQSFEQLDEMSRWVMDLAS